MRSASLTRARWTVIRAVLEELLAEQVRQFLVIEESQSPGRRATIASRSCGAERGNGALHTLGGLTPVAASSAATKCRPDDQGPNRRPAGHQSRRRRASSRMPFMIDLTQIGLEAAHTLRIDRLNLPKRSKQAFLHKIDCYGEVSGPIEADSQPPTAAVVRGTIASEQFVQGACVSLLRQERRNESYEL